jgi:hypothetical protein
LVLEVAHKRAGADPLLQITRGIRETYEINLILAGLMRWVGCDRPGRIERGWALTPIADTEPVEWTSTEVQFGYRHPAVGHIGDQLTVPDMPPAPEGDSQDYYTAVGLSPGATITVPADLSMLLDTYFALEEDERDRTTRWAYWLNHARIVRSHSQSGFYLALMQAVEALLPEVSGEPCDACGRPLGPGPTRKFVEFLELHVPRQDDETERERRELYRLRSALAHGGKLLRSDEPGRQMFGFEPHELIEMDQADRAAAIVRLAGVRWLAAQ